MATNVFYCPKCGKYTTHIEISMREINALEGGNFLTQSISTIMDMTGATRMGGRILGLVYYKCRQCGGASARKANGELDGDFIPPRH